MAVSLGFGAQGNGAPNISQRLQDLNDPSVFFAYHLASDLWLKAGSVDYRIFGSAVGNAAFNPDSRTSIWGYINRAGVQFFPTAGTSIVAGLSQSAFDFANRNVDGTAGMGPSNSYTVASTFSYGMNFLGAASNTSTNGIPLIAWQAQVFQGWTATVALEDAARRRTAIWDGGTDALTVGALPGPKEASSKEYRGSCYSNSIGNSTTDCVNGDYAAQQIPDVVGSLRVDQAWGSAQVAGALHQLRAGYYGNNSPAGSVGPGGYTGVAPGDKWGYAVNAGVVVNLPWAAGDRFWGEGAYTVGAVSYTGFDPSAGLINTIGRFNGGNLANGWAIDAIFANTIGPATPTTVGTVAAPSALQLTTAWTMAAAIEHYWTPGLRSSLFATYAQVDYNDTATDLFCASPRSPVRTTAGAAPNFATGAVIGCNPDFQVWGVGLRTIWNPVKNLDVGFEVMYTKLQQNMDPATVRLNFFGNADRPAGLYIPADQDVWSGVIRVQRNFWP